MLSQVANSQVLRFHREDRLKTCFTISFVLELHITVCHCPLASETVAGSGYSKLMLELSSHK